MSESYLHHCTCPAECDTIHTKPVACLTCVYCLQYADLDTATLVARLTLGNNDKPKTPPASPPSPRKTTNSTNNNNKGRTSVDPSSVAEEAYKGFYNPHREAWEAERRADSDTSASRALLQTPPTKKDWREDGVVSPIRDQGGCGSCWAFAAVALMESLHLMQAKSLGDFSEQQVGGNRWVGPVACSSPTLQRQGVQSTITAIIEVLIVDTACLMLCRAHRLHMMG